MKDLRRLLGLFRPYGGWMALGVFLALVTVLANVALMAVSGWFIASMAVAGISGASINYFTPAAIIRALAIIRTVGRYFERLVTHEATFRLLAHLRRWFYEHLEPLAPARLQAYRAGDVLSRIRADIDVLENFYVRLLVPVVVAVLASAVFTTFLWTISAVLACVVFCLLAVAGVVVPLIVYRAGMGASARQVDTAAELRAHLVEGHQGLGELLAFGALDRHLDRAQTLSHALIDDQRKLSTLQGGAEAGVALGAHLSMWAVLVIVIPLVGAGRVAAADLAMLALFALACFEAVQGLPMAFQTLPAVRAAAKRLFEIVDAEPLSPDCDAPAALPDDLTVCFAGVHFAYAPNGTGAETLSAIDLTLTPGRSLAVLGPTGSGKSTLVNLMMRFWAPTAGAVTLGGCDISTLAAVELRRQFAVVPQRVHLFNTTLRANLLMADPDATPDALARACAVAGLDDFIAGQPDGYDTFVGEAGLKLSGGQVRRLAIARALLKNAPILVLDEPGEGLDPTLERDILDRILGEAVGRTVLLITHSLVGLDRVDEIAVLNRGRIVERGSHADLMAQQGAYRTLQDGLLEFDQLV